MHWNAPELHTMRWISSSGIKMTATYLSDRERPPWCSWTKRNSYKIDFMHWIQTKLMCFVFIALDFRIPDLSRGVSDLDHSGFKIRVLSPQSSICGSLPWRNWWIWRLDHRDPSCYCWRPWNARKGLHQVKYFSLYRTPTQLTKQTDAIHSKIHTKFIRNPSQKCRHFLIKKSSFGSQPPRSPLKRSRKCRFLYEIKTHISFLAT